MWNWPAHTASTTSSRSMRWRRLDAGMRTRIRDCRGRKHAAGRLRRVQPLCPSLVELLLLLLRRGDFFLGLQPVVGLRSGLVPAIDIKFVRSRADLLFQGKSHEFGRWHINPPCPD